MGPEHIESSCSENKVAEATVKLLFEIQVIERLGEVCPVEVRIDPKHLPENGLTDLDKILGKS